jgi:hypothetical protein
MWALPTGARRASAVSSATSAGCAAGEVIEGGGGVAGVPDEHGVDEQLQAEGVAVVVVLVGGRS